MSSTASRSGPAKTAGAKTKAKIAGAEPRANLDYSEFIETQGVKVPFVPSIITPKIEQAMRNNRYEGGECTALRAALRPGDRVLDLGAGVGLLSTLAGSIDGIERVTAIEANPDLIALIRETHRVNGVTGVDLRNGVVSAGAGAAVSFYLRRDFWASSVEPGSRPYDRVASLPNIAITDLIAEVKPTVIICDIEGAELDLFGSADLSGVRSMIIELHPKVYGEAGVARVVGTLAAHGLHISPASKAGSSVQQFERPSGSPASAPGSKMPKRDYRTWPIADPRVLVATCMKDEGPFILEWLAWHRAAGVTDFVVFTNDCSDGTDRLLDRLQDMGEVLHLPNPALATGDTHFQPIALSYVHQMKAFREADFFISMDVDEFINIRTGEGRLTDLFRAAGPFDVLSMSEVNHGSNRQEHYRRGWLTEMFPGHQTEKPGKFKSRRGVKSIVRLSQRVAEIRNHRPDFTPDAAPLWLDGSGRALASLAADRGENGIDARGTFDLVSLDHFPLRSLESFLVKMFRGDVVVAGKQVSRPYWRKRNGNEFTTSDLGRLMPAARAYHESRYASDPTLMGLHEACCAAHEARIAALADDPFYREQRSWILSESW